MGLGGWLKGVAVVSSLITIVLPLSFLLLGLSYMGKKS